MSRAPVLLVVMGVSGTGKSTVASYLADEFSFRYIEADDFHSDENRQLMAAGVALNGDQRTPWMNRVCRELDALCRERENCVLAYSGLRKAHRQRIRSLGFDTRFLYLQADKSIIFTRMESRKGHFMPPGMLASQLQDMQDPRDEGDVTGVDVGESLPITLARARSIAERLFSQAEPGSVDV